MNKIIKIKYFKVIYSLMVLVSSILTFAQTDATEKYPVLEAIHNFVNEESKKVTNVNARKPVYTCTFEHGRVVINIIHNEYESWMNPPVYWRLYNDHMIYVIGEPKENLRKFFTKIDATNKLYVISFLLPDNEGFISYCGSKYYSIEFDKFGVLDTYWGAKPIFVPNNIFEEKLKQRK